MRLLSFTTEEAKSENFPKVCMACLKEENVNKLEHKYEWNSYEFKAGILDLLIFGAGYPLKNAFAGFGAYMPIPLIALVNMAEFWSREEMLVQLRLCPSCMKKFKKRRVMIRFVPIFLIGILVFFLGFLLGWHTGLVTSLAVALFAPVKFLLRKFLGVIKCKYIEGQKITLEMPKEEYVTLFRDFREKHIAI